MKVLLVVERENGNGRISAMVWAAAMAADPEMLETKNFRGDAAFKVWLAGIATRYGTRNITVDWTTLAFDARLTAALKEFVPAS